MPAIIFRGPCRIDDNQSKVAAEECDTGRCGSKQWDHWKTKQVRPYGLDGRDSCGNDDRRTSSCTKFGPVAIRVHVGQDGVTSSVAV